MYYLPGIMYFTRESGFLHSTKEEGKWTSQYIRHMIGMSRCRVRKGRDTTATRDLRRTDRPAMWAKGYSHEHPAVRPVKPVHLAATLVTTPSSNQNRSFLDTGTIMWNASARASHHHIRAITDFFHTYSRFRSHRPSPVQCCAARPTPFDRPPTDTCPVHLARNRWWPPV